MGALKLSACMKVVAKMGEMDQESLLERLDRYTDDGVPKDRAQVMAASDTLAELIDERREFMSMLREQHPDLFVVTNGIPEDQDVDPDQPDADDSSIRRSPARFLEDIPNEAWLQGKIDSAKRAPRNQFGVPRMGSITGYFKEPVMFPARWASELKGERGEQDNVRQQDLAAIRKILRESGKMPLTKDGREYVPYIEIGYDGKPWISEGNHRIMAAVAEGWDYIPAEVRYFDGGQRNAGKWKPDNLIEITGRASEIKRSPARDITETPEFKRWFGDSKVVDEQGKPLVVYHGGRKGLTEFKNPDGRFKTGIFFTDSAAVAEAFGRGGETYPVYLSVQNPFVIDADGEYYSSIKRPDEMSDFAATDDVDTDLIAEWAFQNGYDGVTVRNVLEGRGNQTSTVYIASRNTQIKSAIGNSGQFDPNNADIRRSLARNDMGFYSALAAEIEKAQTKSAPAGAWKTQLKGLVNKGAVKQDEITWSGVEDWLDMQEGKVIKEAIADYLKQGGVRIEETVLGKPLKSPKLTNRQELAKRYDEAIDAAMAADVALNPAYIESLPADQRKPEEQALVDAYNAVNENPDEPWTYDQGQPTKYGQYVLPGGENYREVLLTLPRSSVVEPVIAEGRWRLRDKFTGEFMRSNGNKVIGFESEAEARAAIKQLSDPGMDQFVPGYKSNHWDQKNILAHIRINDRTDAEGKRVLFVEEIQSDWGQDGKKKGFNTPLKTDGWTAKRSDGDPASGPIWEVRNESRQWVLGVPIEKAQTAEEAIAYAARRGDMSRGGGQGGVPAAPFVTKTDGWLNLALKRVIAMAVDGGYDKVAFVNGDQSADRYDLSKQVDEVAIYGDKTLVAFQNGRRVTDREFQNEAELADLIGKDLAEKLLAARPDMNGIRSLAGQQLKVGGEGMKAFYDKIVPNATKALLKKVGGGQMREVAIQSRSDEVVSRDSRMSFYVEGDTVTLQQPGFDITDAMREKVSTEGLTLFSPARAQEDTPEFKAWFDGSHVVDEDGLPKVVYHNTGSSDNFSVFRTDRELGAHFGTVDQANERGPGIGRSTMPVYLSIKNPLRLEDKGDFHAGNVLLQLRRMGMITRSQAANMSSDVREIQRVIEGAGYDGVVYLNRREIPGVFGPDGIDGNDLDEMSDRDVMEFFGDDAQDSWIAFRPEQIKSATGNRGTFDPNDADITRSPGRTATGAAWDSPSAEKFDDLVYKLQDKLVDTKRVVEAIKTASGAIADDLDVYLQEELYHGRAAKRTEDFVNMELNPLIEQMAKDDLKLDDVEEFMHARHAPEANKVIAQRNPGVQDLQDGGSGMETGVALNYMATLPADLKQKLEAAAAKVDAIIAKTRELYVDYELESRDTVDGWGKVFQHYIPLQREDKNGSPGLGQGFSVKGKETKGRTGSTRKVVDIMANIALQREKAIVRGEKNRVSQALVGLATANPNEGFWQVDEVPTERVFNEKTGLVEDRVDPLYKSRENAVIAKIKGADGKVKEHAVLFNEEDPRALRMAQALKNLDANQIEGLLGVSAKITRYFAAVNTQYNPVFGAVNLVRDVQGALLNLSSTPLAGEQAKIGRYTMSALRGIYADARAARKGNNPTSQWAALWDEFQDVGGQTGYRDLFRTSEDRANAIKDTLNPDAWADSRLGKIFTANGALKVPLAQAKRGAGWIFQWLSDYNLAMENGVRLAAYKAGLEKGMSKEQAASAAKNLTVNFNRKGQVSQQAGALYAFFNASLQGTARLGQTLFDMEPGKPKTIRLSSTGKKIVYGGIMLGSIQAMALAAAGFNDDDPPEFARERGLIIPIGGKKYVTIPMPLGFHVIPNIGRIATEFALSGFKDPHERALSLASLFADTFNPIGNSGLSMQTLAPTALDPLVALTENKDWTGKPIARESSNKAIPGHALGRDTASSIAKFLSEGINTLSGGNKYVAGVFSPTPDQIDYLLGQVTGGVGRELSKVEQTVLATARGEDLPTYKVPLVGRFVGDAKSQASEGAAFYANTERLNKLETEIKGLEKDGKRAEAAELRRNSSEAYLITVANQAERQIQRLRAEKRELVKAGAPREQVKAVEERITAVMSRLNRAAEALREKQEN